MSKSAGRDPQLDEWRDRIAEEVRAYMARDRMNQADAARAMGMTQKALSRRLLGEVSFKSEELYWLADWMNRNIDEILAAAKARATNPCLSYSGSAVVERGFWATAGYVLAGWGRAEARQEVARRYGLALRAA